MALASWASILRTARAILLLMAFLTAAAGALLALSWGEVRLGRRLLQGSAFLIVLAMVASVGLATTRPPRRFHARRRGDPQA